MSLPGVHIRPVDRINLEECLSLELAPGQDKLVAPVARSLAQAYVNPNLIPLAIYPEEARGFEAPDAKVLGFAMLEIEAGVGFILRLVIDRRYQREGYGTAAMLELMRRLKLDPRVEMIGTSHRQENQAVAAMLAKLGFIPWGLNFGHTTGEVFLQLDSINQP